MKHALGRLTLADPPRVYVPRERERHGIAPLALTEADALELAQLRPIKIRSTVCWCAKPGFEG